MLQDIIHIYNFNLIFNKSIVIFIASFFLISAWDKLWIYSHFSPFPVLIIGQIQ